MDFFINNNSPLDALAASTGTICCHTSINGKWLPHFIERLKASAW